MGRDQEEDALDAAEPAVETIAEMVDSSQAHAILTSAATLAELLRRTRRSKRAEAL